MITTKDYKGFELDWVDEQKAYSVALEGELITYVGTVEIAEKCIDFFHEASCVSFGIHRKRAEKARQEGRDNAGPEPELAKHGRPNAAWVKWYRGMSGCGLREAYSEAERRIVRG